MISVVDSGGKEVVKVDTASSQFSQQFELLRAAGEDMELDYRKRQSTAPEYPVFVTSVSIREARSLLSDPSEAKQWLHARELANMVPDEKRRTFKVSELSRLLVVDGNLVKPSILQSLKHVCGKLTKKGEGMVAEELRKAKHSEMRRLDVAPEAAVSMEPSPRMGRKAAGESKKRFVELDEEDSSDDFVNGPEFARYKNKKKKSKDGAAKKVPVLKGRDNNTNNSNNHNEGDEPKENDKSGALAAAAAAPTSMELEAAAMAMAEKKTAYKGSPKRLLGEDEAIAVIPEAVAEAAATGESGAKRAKPLKATGPSEMGRDVISSKFTMEFEQLRAAGEDVELEYRKRPSTAPEYPVFVTSVSIREARALLSDPSEARTWLHARELANMVPDDKRREFRVTELCQLLVVDGKLVKPSILQSLKHVCGKLTKKGEGMVAEELRKEAQAAKKTSRRVSLDDEFAMSLPPRAPQIVSATNVLVAPTAGDNGIDDDELAGIIASFSSRQV